MKIPAFLWLLAGTLVCLLVWFVPLANFGVTDFPLHMIRHMTLVAIAAPCLVLGAPRLRRVMPSIPLLASFAEFVIVWSWHMPAAHELARISGVWLIAEQACFLMVGVLLWASVLDPARALAGAGALLLTSMHMTLLGALIILSPRELYLCSDFNNPTMSLESQQMGGMIMLVIGTPVYLLAGLWRTRDALYPESSDTSIRKASP